MTFIDEIKPRYIIEIKPRYIIKTNLTYFVFTLLKLTIKLKITFVAPIIFPLYYATIGNNNLLHCYPKRTVRLSREHSQGL